MSYTVDYFIKKFEAIPDDKWCVGKFVNEDRCCAAGHCGCTNENPETEEVRALFELLHSYDMSLFTINDGIGELTNYECFAGMDVSKMNPRTRILRALNWVKEQIECEPV